ncbi:hypothetical protein [Nocardia sp. NPDC052566]|uniref:hypothetical protein n=1 Tax=Nocardia sp. NPDC052566 TaxID=3364330 RepID=UPI0037CCB5CD
MHSGDQKGSPLATRGFSNYFAEQTWITDPAAVLGREHQPKPVGGLRVRSREAIDRLVGDKRQPLEDRMLWSMLYATATDRHSISEPAH